MQPSHENLHKSLPFSFGKEHFGQKEDMESCNKLSSLDEMNTKTYSNSSSIITTKLSLDPQSLQELERKRNKIFAKFDQEEKSEKMDYDIRLYEKLHKSKGKLHHKKSLKIQSMAKLLENHITSVEAMSLEPNNIMKDEYMGIVLEKPVSVNKGRKKTLAKFAA